MTIVVASRWYKQSEGQIHCAHLHWILNAFDLQRQSSRIPVKIYSGFSNSVIITGFLVRDIYYLVPPDNLPLHDKDADPS